MLYVLKTELNKNLGFQLVYDTEPIFSVKHYYLMQIGRRISTFMKLSSHFSVANNHIKIKEDSSVR